MKINITYAASVANAPAGYKAAVEAAVAIYEGLIRDPITVNITFGYGDVGSQPVPDSAIGVSTSDHGYALTYTELRSALGEAARSYFDAVAVTGLTPYDMTDGGLFYIPAAQAKALGLTDADSTRNDGFVGLSTKQPMNFSTTQRAVSGQYDAVGIFLHEIGHVLGRVSYQGDSQSDGSSVYAALDLFRTTNGVHDPVDGRSVTPGSYSTIGTLNDPSNGGSSADWGPSVFGDAYNAFGSLGVKVDISWSDVSLLDLLGYRVDAAPTSSIPGLVDPLNLVNTLTIAPQSPDPTEVTIGIKVTGANLAGAPSHIITYENRVTIGGEYAFLEAPTAPLPTDYKARIINSGMMIGDVAVGSVASEIRNTGSMVGDILFGDGDNSFDGTGGRFVGDLMLGNGTSHIKLGDDGESVIAERGTVDLIGGTGVDTLSYVLSSVGVTIDLRTTTAQTVASGAMLTVRGVENLTGSVGADRLTGDAGANRFYDRFGGDDVFVGGGGNDLLWVERYTTTPTSSVSLDGGDGDDRLIARGLAAASLVGGAGNDQVVVDATGGSYQVALGAGADTLFLASTGPVSSSIVVTDFAPDDRLDFDLFLDDALTNHTDGADPFASGHLRLVQSGADTLLQVDAHGGGDSFSTLVTLRNTAAGSLFPSDLEGFVSNIYAGAALPGTSGADALVAQPGRNALQGLGGDDTLTGGAGPDFLDGGAGLDTAVYRGLSRAYGLSLDGQGGGKVSGGPEGGVDGLSGVERLKFVDGYMSISTADTTAQVYRIYVAALGRTPDAPGLGSWVRAMEGGANLSAVAAGFLGSPEFNARFGGSTTSNSQFVTLLYANVLHRQPDASGMNTWLNYLSSGHSRAETVIGFSESSENIRNTAPSVQQGLWVGDPNAGVAARLYDTVFGRLPDAPGLTDWTRALNTGTSLTQVAAGFVNAPEFQSTYGALNDAAFVNLLYQNVLHRQADQPGLASWTGLLAQGQSRADVVIGFSESPEHIRLTAPQIDNGVWFA